MLRSALLALALPVLLVAAPAAAGPAACSAEQPDAPLYVVKKSSQHGEVWREGNGVAGLQRAACAAPDGSIAQPDPFVAHYGVTPGGQPICVPRLPCIWI